MTIRISPDTRARINARREHFTLLRTSTAEQRVLSKATVNDKGEWVWEQRLLSRDENGWHEVTL